MEATGTSLDLLFRMMSASTERARVISSNIANVDTPGYRRSDVRFEDLLRDASQSGRTDLSNITPRIEEDTLTPANADGNNVTLELELNASRQNRLLYETYAAIMQTHFEMLRAGIESGR